MRIETIELIRVSLPLRSPWHTAAGVMTERESILVNLRSDVGDGWGECVAFSSPSYSAEFVGSALLVLRDRLLPLLLAGGPRADITGADVDRLLSPVAGHHMAKAALEMAVLDAELRAAGRSLAEHLGASRDRVEAGVAIGFAPDVGELCERVDAAVEAGYRRVKLKIEPGRDVDRVAAVRERFPALTMYVDANGAYTRDDADHLARLDDFGLALIEQPLDAEDLVGHALLADRLKTPICLDEPITSVATTESAVALGACEVVNLKPGRVGGYLEARRIHDFCADRGLPLWCGGMLETGLGRAANVALAALPGFTLTGDLSASDRFYERDIVTEPVALVDGMLTVPTAPGIGSDIDHDAVAAFRVN